MAINNAKIIETTKRLTGNPLSKKEIIALILYPTKTILDPQAKFIDRLSNELEKQNHEEHNF